MGFRDTAAMLVRQGLWREDRVTATEAQCDCIFLEQ